MVWKSAGKLLRRWRRIGRRTTSAPVRRLVVERLDERRVLAGDWQNVNEPLDVNADRLVTARDALIVVNDLMARGEHRLTVPRTGGDFFFDVTGDSAVTLADVVPILNHLASPVTTAGTSATNGVSFSTPLGAPPSASVPGGAVVGGSCTPHQLEWALPCAGHDVGGHGFDGDAGGAGAGGNAHPGDGTGDLGSGEFGSGGGVGIGEGGGHPGSAEDGGTDIGNTDGSLGTEDGGAGGSGLGGSAGGVRPAEPGPGVSECGSLHENRAPLGVNDQYSTRTDQLLDVRAPGVLGNDSDPDCDRLTARLETSPRHGTIGLQSDGAFLYTPAAGFVGADQFTYRAYDGRLFSNSVTVDIAVLDVPHGGGSNGSELSGGSESGTDMAGGGAGDGSGQGSVEGGDVNGGGGANGDGGVGGGGVGAGGGMGGGAGIGGGVDGGSGTSGSEGSGSDGGEGEGGSGTGDEVSGDEGGRINLQITMAGMVKLGDDNIATLQWNNDYDRSPPQEFQPLADKDRPGSERVTSDDEIVAFGVRLDGPRGRAVSGLLRVVYDSQKLRLWYMNGDEIRYLPSGRNLGPLEIRSLLDVSLFVEGRKVSSSLNDARLDVSFIPASGSLGAVSDHVLFHVVDIDLQFSQRMLDWDEDTLGGLLPVNRDHDENNTARGVPVPDFEPQDGVHRIVRGDDELREGKLHLDPGGKPGTWRITPAAGVKVWSKVDLSEFTQTRDFAAMTVTDIELYVEGIVFSHGGVGTDVIHATFIPSDTPEMRPDDEVKWTVMDIDLELKQWKPDVAVAEYEEETRIGVLPTTDPMLGGTYWLETSVTVHAPNGVAGWLWVEIVGAEEGKPYVTFQRGPDGFVPRTSRATAVLITLNQSEARFQFWTAPTQWATSKFTPSRLVAHFQPRDPAFGTAHNDAIEDSVKLRVADVDLEIDVLNEFEEMAIGAFVRNNDDYSKGQPVPDNQAPADSPWLFDPHFDDEYTKGSVDWGEASLEHAWLTFDYSDIVVVWDAKTQKLIGGHETIPVFDRRVPIYVEGKSRSALPVRDAVTAEVTFPDGYFLRALAPLIDRVKLTVVDLAAAFDGDHNGLIDYAAAVDRQLTFWFNDDQEGPLQGDMAIQSDVDSVLTNDSQDQQITTTRDLEDFAPLNLQLDPYLFHTPGSVSVSYSLELAAIPPLEPLNEVTLKVYRDDAGQRLDSRRHVASVQSSARHKNDPAYSQSIGQTSWKSDRRTAWTLTGAAAGENPFLIEANRRAFRAAAQSEFEVVLTSLVEYGAGGTKRLVSRIPLHLLPIKSFYDLYDVQYANADLMDPTVTSLPNYRHIRDSAVAGRPGFEDAELVLLVHGWNMPAFWKDAFAETAYKRLYWQGYRGRFGAFNWPTFFDADADPANIFPDSVEGINNSTIWSTYNASDFTAYRSAAAFKALLVDLHRINVKPHVLAHSMGNIVVGEGLRLWSEHNPAESAVKSYMALQAAVPSGAYGSDANHYPSIVTTVDFYRNFPGFMRPTDAANGAFALFRDSHHAADKWVNVYNPDDYALNKWSLNNSLGKYLNVGNTVNQFWKIRYTSQPAGLPLWKWMHLRWTNNSTVVGIFDRPLNPYVLGLGPNSYEVLAFIAVSDTKPVGQVPMPAGDRNWVNYPLNTLGFDPAMPGGKGRPNHSFEFHYDSATTWAFWSMVFRNLAKP